MLNTFEKIRAHEARRVAIQRQMEDMEAAASSRGSSSRLAVASLVGFGTQSGSTRKRGHVVTDSSTQPQHSMDAARRFLWEDDEEDEGPSRADGTGDVPVASMGGFMGSLVSIFGGGKTSISHVRQKHGGRFRGGHISPFCFHVVLHLLPSPRAQVGSCNWFMFHMDSNPLGHGHGEWSRTQALFGIDCRTLGRHSCCHLFSEGVKRRQHFVIIWF
jgi:hypothetical protein